eukprot:IDg12990t1
MRIIVHGCVYPNDAGLYSGNAGRPFEKRTADEGAGMATMHGHVSEFVGELDTRQRRILLYAPCIIKTGKFTPRSAVTAQKHLAGGAYILEWKWIPIADRVKATTDDKRIKISAALKETQNALSKLQAEFSISCKIAAVLRNAFVNELLWIFDSQVSIDASAAICNHESSLSSVRLSNIQLGRCCQ